MEIRTVDFGRYPQGKTGEATPIRWIILHQEAEKCLLISEQVLENGPFHRRDMDMDWEGSSLRDWLNDTFLNEAFSSEERGRILPTEKGDQVFLLSREEAEQYFAKPEERGAAPTEYVKERVYVNEENGNAWWWLRTQGDRKCLVMVIMSGGGIHLPGTYVDRLSGGIRPALWIQKI